jgi:hypothetical protein
VCNFQMMPRDLTVIAPGLAPSAVGGQQRLHAGEGFVGELQHRVRSWARGVQERDPIEQHHPQQQSAAAVLGNDFFWKQGAAADGQSADGFNPRRRR